MLIVLEDAFQIMFALVASLILNLIPVWRHSMIEDKKEDGIPPSTKVEGILPTIL